MTIESRLAIALLIVALLFGASLCYAQAGKLSSLVWFSMRAGCLYPR